MKTLPPARRRILSTDLLRVLVGLPGRRREKGIRVGILPSPPSLGRTSIKLASFCNSLSVRDSRALGWFCNSSTKQGYLFPLLGLFDLAASANSIRRRIASGRVIDTSSRLEIHASILARSGGCSRTSIGSPLPVGGGPRFFRDITD